MNKGMMLILAGGAALLIAGKGKKKKRSRSTDSSGSFDEFDSYSPDTPGPKPDVKPKPKPKPKPAKEQEIEISDDIEIIHQDKIDPSGTDDPYDSGKGAAEAWGQNVSTWQPRLDKLRQLGYWKGSTLNGYDSDVKNSVYRFQIDMEGIRHLASMYDQAAESVSNSDGPINADGDWTDQTEWWAMWASLNKEMFYTLVLESTGRPPGE